MNAGIHYWEIIIDPITENELKIGVYCGFSMDNYNVAFCDTNLGFGFYGTGQLRNGSNSQGNGYGQPVKNQGTVGVYLNMNKGHLYFTLNGASLGLAYNNPRLTVGPIFPAVSLLHKAGFTLKPNPVIPPQLLNM